MLKLASPRPPTSTHRPTHPFTHPYSSLLLLLLLVLLLCSAPRPLRCTCCSLVVCSVARSDSRLLGRLDHPHHHRLFPLSLPPPLLAFLYSLHHSIIPSLVVARSHLGFPDSRILGTPLASRIISSHMAYFYTSPLVLALVR
ncbi:hypothetical protein C8Q70DRAFT_262661 [Cubamyces menziesii]|nr:hypothetical protein C8Q70DRAFT_262661 [Cubamyces menziesii]